MLLIALYRSSFYINKKCFIIMGEYTKKTAAFKATTIDVR
jgi:hypothetical protein